VKNEFNAANPALLHGQTKSCLRLGTQASAQLSIPASRKDGSDSTSKCHEGVQKRPQRPWANRAFSSLLVTSKPVADLLQPGFGIAEQHFSILLVEHGVVKRCVAQAHGALHHDAPLRLPDTDDRHARYW